MQIAGQSIGIEQPFFLIAGPCVIESRDMALRTAEDLEKLARHLKLTICYKSSFDKANRTSSGSFRGPGMHEGLAILQDVKDRFDLPVLTDVHSVDQVDAAAAVVDILQIPAFLCRQTDLVEKAAQSGRLVNIKKGQFLAPGDMQHVVQKATAGGARDRILVCERGASFGYNNLVVDMRSLEIMRETGCPVVFDATHSVQIPGGRGKSSDGQRQFIPLLARAAVASGISGLFMETHPDPDQALSDGPNSWPLQKLPKLLEELIVLDELVKDRILKSR